MIGAPSGLRGVLANNATGKEFENMIFLVVLDTLFYDCNIALLLDI